MTGSMIEREREREGWGERDMENAREGYRNGKWKRETDI